MTCYHPISGYQEFALNGRPVGRFFTSNVKLGKAFRALTIPCGRCIGCRLDYSKQWAVRCVHEISLHEENCFATLTYNDDNLPENASLDFRDLELFFKRMRKSGKSFRYFACGEYGDRFGRPHYHVIFFGYRPDVDIDRSSNHHGNPVFACPEIEDIWNNGFVYVGDANYKSAAYVARYITKKIKGEAAVHHYNVIDYSTGEILKEKVPEQVRMSRRPGIGFDWIEKYYNGVYVIDKCVINAGDKVKELKVPRYYDEYLKKKDEKRFNRLKIKRFKEAVRNADDNTPERLAVKESIQKNKAKRLERNYEKEMEKIT